MNQNRWLKKQAKKTWEMSLAGLSAEQLRTAGRIYEMEDSEFSIELGNWPHPSWASKLISYGRKINRRYSTDPRSAEMREMSNKLLNGEQLRKPKGLKKLRSSDTTEQKRARVRLRMNL